MRQHVERLRVLLEQQASELTSEQVVDILMGHPGNAQRPREQVGRWVVSDQFRLTTVHAALPSLGVTAGKVGISISGDKPIIIDDNVQQVARSFEGIGGAAPDFLVLDGQNRVVAARKRGMGEVLSAYVGNRVFSEVKRQDGAFKDVLLSVKTAEEKFLAMPSGKAGGALTVLKSFVDRGLLSQERLADLRAEWRKRRRE